MRLLVFGLTALAIIFGLLLFDDIDTGLPVVSLIVWLAVLLAGLLLVLRFRVRGRRGAARPRIRRARRLAPRRRARPLLLPHRQD